MTHGGKVANVIHEAVVDGIRLTYREEGDPGAPALVLLHGRTADHNDWNGITQHFAARHHVIVPDLRGHGASEHPGDYAMSSMAGDVVALLGRLGIGRTVLIGHSLGGLVAYLVAMDHPALVERLVLEDPAPPYGLEGRPPVEEDGSTGFDWRMMHQTERQIVAGDPAWAEGLGRITAPTLVLAGARSHLRAGIVAERIPGAEVVTIDAGHLIHTDARADFLKAVDTFLAEP